MADFIVNRNRILTTLHIHTHIHNATDGNKSRQTQSKNKWIEEFRRKKIQHLWMNEWNLMENIYKSNKISTNKISNLIGYQRRTTRKRHIIVGTREWFTFDIYIYKLLTNMSFECVCMYAWHIFRVIFNICETKIKFPKWYLCAIWFTGVRLSGSQGICGWKCEMSKANIKPN